MFRTELVAPLIQVSAGFISFGAVLLYAVGAALFAELIGLALVRLGFVKYAPLGDQPASSWSWFRVWVHTALIYAFWWLVSNGPVQLGQ